MTATPRHLSCKKLSQSLVRDQTLWNVMNDDVLRINTEGTRRLSVTLTI